MKTEILSILESTATKTKVTTALEPYPLKQGLSRVVRKINYHPQSAIAKKGIDSVCIRKAGKQGSYIVARHGGDIVADGFTRPIGNERTVMSRIKEFMDYYTKHTF